MGEARRQGRGRHGRQQRHRPGHGQAVRGRGGQGRHHRPPAGGAGRGGRRDRPRGDRRAGGRLEAGGPRPALRDGQGEARAGRRPVRQRRRRRSSPRSATITEEHFDREFDINVKGLLFTVQKALPLFADGGSIILNASIVSIKGMAAFSVYSATKAAVRSFARTWTVDLKDRKIRVNALSPGPIETPGVDGLGRSTGGGRADQGRPRRAGPAGPDGRRRRDRQGRRVPRLGRQQLRHRASSCSSTAGWRRFKKHGPPIARMGHRRPVSGPTVHGQGLRRREVTADRTTSTTCGRVAIRPRLT